MPEKKQLYARCKGKLYPIKCDCHKSKSWLGWEADLERHYNNRVSLSFVKREGEKDLFRCAGSDNIVWITVAPGLVPIMGHATLVEKK